MNISAITEGVIYEGSDGRRRRAYAVQDGRVWWRAIGRNFTGGRYLGYASIEHFARWARKEIA
jgi:hypothetical protein